jgi:nitrate reductase NapE component
VEGAWIRGSLLDPDGQQVTALHALCLATSLRARLVHHSMDDNSHGQRMSCGAPVGAFRLADLTISIIPMGSTAVVGIFGILVF